MPYVRKGTLLPCLWENSKSSNNFTLILFLVGWIAVRSSSRSSNQSSETFHVFMGDGSLVVVAGVSDRSGPGPSRSGGSTTNRRGDHNRWVRRGVGGICTTCRSIRFTSGPLFATVLDVSNGNNTCDCCNNHERNTTAARFLVIILLIGTSNVGSVRGSRGRSNRRSRCWWMDEAFLQLQQLG